MATYERLSLLAFYSVTAEAFVPVYSIIWTAFVTSNHFT